MKEIKAYVRSSMASRVIQALSERGELHFSLLHVRGISHGLAREVYDYSVELGEVFQSMIKLELICRDDQAESLAETIRQAAQTGRKGDGAIFIAAIEDGIRINSGERGEAMLRQLKP